MILKCIWMFEVIKIGSGRLAVILRVYIFLKLFEIEFFKILCWLSKI